MLRVLFLLLVLLSVEQPVLADERIRITIGEWEPFIGADLPHYGVVPYIITRIFEDAGIDVEYGFFPWKRSYLLVKNGDWHASAIWGKTPEREEECTFSDVLYTGETVLFYHQQDPLQWQGDPDKLELLDGVVIGLAIGSAKARLMEKAESRGLVAYDRARTKFQTFHKLLNQRYEAVDETKAVGLHILQTRMSEADRNQITHTPAYEAWPYYLIFSRQRSENQRFRMIFDQGLRAMKASGDYEHIWADFYRGRFSNTFAE